MTAHREAGGLRRLDFYVDRAEVWSAGRDRSHIRVLVVGVGVGGVAQAFASLGYRVTGVDGDAYAVERSRATSKDLGFDVSYVVGSARAVQGGPFQIIVIERLVYGNDAAEQLADLRPLLAAGGIILCTGRHMRQETLRAKGWRTTELRAAGVFLRPAQKFFRRMGQKRGSRSFHVFDSLDAAMASHAPLWASDAWLMELRPFDPKRPYVIHVTHELGVGGAERLVYELVARLPAHGFDAKAVTVFYGGRLETAFRDENLPLAVLRKKGLIGLGTVLDLARLFRLERPDVVHTHLFLADTWGRIAAWLAGVRVVVTTEHNVNPSYGWGKRLVNRCLTHITKTHIAVSDEVKRVLAAEDRVAPKKIKTILNGIDLARVIPRGARPFRDIPRIIIVGRLSPQKDHATLLKALALVKRPWRLMVVGAGSLERDLRGMAERLRIAPRVEWLGEREDVPELLASADVFCFPSRYEGLGLAAVEAAAAGVPVVASDLAPLKEVLEPNDAAYVPVGDVPAWAHAIESTLNDPVEAVLRAARAVPRIWAKVSIDAMVSSYADVYRSALKRRKIKS